MTIIQLSYIVAVDNYRSFAKAAEKCFITQPTLSMQIQKLEDELGVLLFDRSKQPVKTTDIGLKIIEQARVVLDEFSRINDVIDLEKKEIVGTFKIGIIPTIAPSLLPLFIQKIVTKYDKLEVIINELETNAIIQKLKSDELDAGIVATPLGKDDIVEEPLYYEPFVGYLSKEHRLWKKKKLSPGDLLFDDLFLLKEGHCFREQVIKICSKHMEDKKDSSRNINFEGSNLDTLKKMVEKNFGMTLMPYLSTVEMKNTENHKRIRLFEPPMPIREISIVFQRAKLKKHIIDIFVNEIKNSVPRKLLNKEGTLLEISI